MCPLIVFPAELRIGKTGVLFVQVTSWLLPLGMFQIMQVFGQVSGYIFLWSCSNTFAAAQARNCTVA